MKMNALKRNVLQLFQNPYHLIESPLINAKLILFKSGSYIMMRFGIYIKINAQRHMGMLALFSGQFVDDVQFGNRLHIEAGNVVVEPQLYFPVGLPHTGKNNTRWGKARIQSTLHLKTAHTVDPQTKAADHLQNTGIGVGLYGIMHHETMLL